MDSFFETGDDFTVGNYAESLLASDHAQHGIHLRAYISMWRLTASKAETFSRLGVANVFIGLETVDPKINRWSRRGVTAKTARNKLAMLHDNGILADMAVMFGMPGESLGSLDAIEQLVYELVDRFDNIRMVLISVGMPLIGSSWYEQLACDPYIQGNYAADLGIIDVPDYSRLSELSVRRHCAATCTDIVETMERLRHHLCERVVVGCFGALEKNWEQAPRAELPKLVAPVTS